LIEGPRWQLIESWQSSQSRQTAVARAMAWPDVSVRLGHRWFEEGDDHAWLVGVSVPFPLFDRNTDGIRAARAGETRANAEATAQQRRLRESLDTSLERVRSAYATAARLDTETLPLARRSYALVEEGYRLGQYELLYLLEAQQTLFTVEAGVAQALGELHFALSDLDELLVTPTGSAGAH
jgi:cobalt-zinc-cadmium efflux system outer membrane protein